MLIAYVAILACHPALAAGHPAQSSELLVRVSPGVPDSEVEALGRQAGAQQVQRRYAPRHFLIRVPEDKAAFERVRQALSRSPQIEAVSPNYLGEAGFVPNDGLFLDQWHLEQDSDIDVNASAAWDISRGSDSIVVAVLDSGLRLDHPEFSGRIAANSGEVLNGVDDDGNGLVDDVNGWDFVGDFGVGDSDPTDEYGHGTWVSSVVAANGDDGFGVAGIDHAARILPLRVLDADNRGSLSDLIDALYYAVDQGADVVNLSLINYPREAMLGAALQAAEDAGAIIVACAGNAGDGTADEYYPGAHPATISVGSTSPQDARAWFSSFGSSVSFTAPGESILVADDQSPYEPDKGRVVNGCSLATPIVAGVVSLLKGMRPDLDRIGVEAILAETAQDLGAEGRDPEFGWGRIDAARALEAATVVQPGASDIVFASGYEG